MTPEQRKAARQAVANYAEKPGFSTGEVGPEPLYLRRDRFMACRPYELLRKAMDALDARDALLIKLRTFIAHCVPFDLSKTFEADQLVADIDQIIGPLFASGEEGGK